MYLKGLVWYGGSSWSVMQRSETGAKHPGGGQEEAVLSYMNVPKTQAVSFAARFYTMHSLVRRVLGCTRHMPTYSY